MAGDAVWNTESMIDMKKLPFQNLEVFLTGAAQHTYTFVGLYVLH